MIETGGALAVMGNHEFNAICYATQHDGGYIRAHNEKHTGQHKAFLNEFPIGTPEYDDVIAWFKTLPVYLDLLEIGVIHACWHSEHIEALQDVLDEKQCLTTDAYAAYADKTKHIYDAIEVLLKGPEWPLPEALYFKDKDGNPREHARLRWWEPQNAPMIDKLEFGGAELSQEQKDLLQETQETGRIELPEKPIFVGHYWLKGDPEPLSDNVVCVDYSIAKNGKLAAYRYDGGQLNRENFVWVQSSR